MVWNIHAIIALSCEHRIRLLLLAEEVVHLSSRGLCWPIWRATFIELGFSYWRNSLISEIHIVLFGNFLENPVANIGSKRILFRNGRWIIGSKLVTIFMFWSVADLCWFIIIVPWLTLLVRCYPIVSIICSITILVSLPSTFLSLIGFQQTGILVIIPFFLLFCQYHTITIFLLLVYFIKNFYVHTYMFEWCALLWFFSCL